jgi:fatty-acyl-CoA synthase
LRDENGRCIRCDRGEVGEAIGRISARDGGGRFEGYTTFADTKTKILNDVFEAGDAWFRTGDLMRQDARGFYYFVDRVGDTFRWKGENVSTGEVAAVLAAAPGVLEAEVYGVPVAGADGKAGMAALTIDSNFDLAILRAELADRLPPYARPVFLRITDKIAATETFKPKKQLLAAEGIDPALITDRLYVETGAGYAPMDAAMAVRIAAGQVRL